MNQDTQLIALLSGVIIPILVGIVTKASAPSGLKAILNAALSAAGAALAQIIPGHFVFKQFLIVWASTWVVSIATHFGLYKPVGVTDAVVNSTSTFGVG